MRPEPTLYDWLDWLDLSHDRVLTIYQTNDPDCLNNPPKILLEEFDGSDAFERMKAGGSIWIYPEDLPTIIRWLQKWLEAFRGCSALDAQRTPAPYWGDLGKAPTVDDPLT